MIRHAFRRFLALGLCIVLAASPAFALAHSGRTDARGGHKDNKNKSGLGSYHYHCGGHPAHLHQGGVCPYASGSTAAKSAKSSSGASSSAKASPRSLPFSGIIGAEGSVEGWIRCLRCWNA